MAQNETFERDYLIPKDQYNPDDHERQFNDVRQQAIQQGWHPTGDVSFNGAEMHGSVTVRLKYSVPVVLASDAEKYEEKHVRVPQDAQAALEKAVASDGSPTIEEVDAELHEENVKALRERGHEDEPTPVPENIPASTGVNTGPSEPGEDGEKPPPRSLHGDTDGKSAEARKAPAKKSAAKKTAAKKEGDA